MGKTFGERFAALRQRRGWTQQDLANELGVVAKYVGMIENDKKTVDPESSLAKLFNLIEGAEGNRFTSGPEDGPAPPKIQEARYSSAREKLQRTLERKNLSTGALAKKMKYDAAIIENVVNGSGRVSESMAKAIVRAIESDDLTVEDLLDGSETPRVFDESGIFGAVGATPTVQLPGGRTRNVPVIAWAAAGALTNAAALDESDASEGISSTVPGRAFAVPVEGDSMYPEINPGDFAVVRYDIPARPGQVVLVKTIHGDVLCKRFTTREREQLVILSSVNKSYEPIEIPMSEVAWIYPVKQVIRNY